MNREVVSAIKRQIPFLIGGTVTGVIMTYFWGFAVTIIVNSIMWYLISLVCLQTGLEKEWVKGSNGYFEICPNENKNVAASARLFDYNM